MVFSSSPYISLRFQIWWFSPNLNCSIVRLNKSVLIFSNPRHSFYFWSSMSIRLKFWSMGVSSGNFYPPKRNHIFRLSFAHFNLRWVDPIMELIVYQYFWDCLRIKFSISTNSFTVTSNLATHRQVNDHLLPFYFTRQISSRKFSRGSFFSDTTIRSVAGHSLIPVTCDLRMRNGWTQMRCFSEFKANGQLTCAILDGQVDYTLRCTKGSLFTRLRHT